MSATSKPQSIPLRTQTRCLCTQATDFSTTNLMRVFIRIRNSPRRKPAVGSSPIETQHVAVGVTKIRFPPEPALIRWRRVELRTERAQSLVLGVQISTIKIEGLRGFVLVKPAERTRGEA